MIYKEYVLTKKIHVDFYMRKWHG